VARTGGGIRNPAEPVTLPYRLLPRKSTPSNPIYGMMTFWQLLKLLVEERQQLVSPAVLQSYDFEFKQALNSLIERTQDAVLRKKFQDMLDCPVKDGRGNCRGFAEYILSALIKNGIHQQYDIEGALSYVFEKMMMPIRDTGEPRVTLFGDFDETKPYTPNFNPLQARFFKFLQFAINNVKKGKIVRLSNVERRPEGSVSIGLGRRKDDDTGTISPDQIAARKSGEADFSEIVADLTELLKKKEPAYGLPLVRLFQAIIAGKNTEQQRQQFGDRTTRTARPIIVQTIRAYAESTGNYHLLSLLTRFEGFRANQPAVAGRRLAKTVKPRLPEKERDFASILAVIDRFDRPVGTPDLGKYRRRWLDYPPRNAASGHRNRLEEVLDMMTKEGVLTAIRTQKGAFVYTVGPNAASYQQSAAG